MNKGKRIVVYEMVCTVCGHNQIDNIPWTKCSIQGCKGEYMVVAEFPAGF
ncbi:MAG: hypothetical protein QHH15_00455 [Candidatus Thermoplasmatota archaeon]|nr:hypothetical protein [Candidatus Thermoplasmatota archaeon]MDH7506245.1 hypothetical protein [Candidatus Thermoplasmatota archaeon]